MYKRIIKAGLTSLIFLLARVEPGYSQAGVGPYTMPSIGSPVPLAPNAAAFAKYGEIPVSLYTGIPNISIPIYEIKSGTLSMPISLSYHAGGNRVEEISSWVGLGWSLNAGGVINRQVRGLPDEGDGGYLNDYHTLNQAIYGGLSSSSDRYTFYNNVENGIMDSQQDLFIYNFGTESGKFFLDSTGKATSIPVTRIKFELGTFEGSTNCWKVTDTRGDQYFFLMKETTTSTPSSSGSRTPNPPPPAVTSWYLTKVKNAQGTDSISLSYTAFAITTNTGIAQTKYLLELSGGGCSQKAPDYRSGANITFGWELSEIDFNNGKIVFNTAAEARCDLSTDRALSSIEIFNSSGSFHTKYQLHQSYMSTSGPGCDQTNEENNRLFLDSLSYTDASGAGLKRYSMTYNKSIALPARSSFNQDHWGYFNGADNQLNFVPTMDVVANGTIVHLAGANREPNSTYNQAGILQSIKYPTGGRTDYEYETNTAYNTNITTSTTAGTRQIFISNGTMNGRKYLDTTFVQGDLGISLLDGVNAQISINNGGSDLCNTGAAIGCPIGSITGPVTISPIYQNVPSSFLPMGTYHLVIDLTSVLDQSILDNFFLTISWQYSSINYDTLRNNTNVGGLRIKRIASYASDNTKTNVHKYNYFLPDSVNHSSGFLVSLPEYQGEIQIPSDVICSYLTYSSFSNYPLISTNGSYTGYKYVQELLGENGEYGMNLYQFVAPDSVTDIVSTVSPYPPGTSFDWERGMLVHLKSYRWDGPDLGYRLVSETSKVYEFNRTVSLLGLQITRTRFNTIAQNDVDGPDVYLLSPFQTASGWSPLIKQIDVQYDQNNTSGIASRTTNYVYSGLHYQPIQIATDNSNGETTVAKMSYPFDYTGLTGSDALTKGMIDLQNSNIVAPVIEKYIQRVSPDGSLIGTVNAVFNSYKPASLLPDTVWQTEFTRPSADFSPLSVAGGRIIKDGSYRPQLNYSKYDANLNISQQEKIGDMRHAYIWDYKGSYPICKVDNADSNSIAFTSFEAEQTGNWLIGSGSLIPSNGLTGRASYMLSGVISKTGLNPSAVYIVSYWSKNSGALNIPGTLSGYPQKGKTVIIDTSNWTLYIHKITGQSTISISGGGQIDELRLYPANAQMTTYTYDPLVGMTSQTDVGNRITYYEYDGLARLKRIRDQDYNILKTLEYQYQAQGGCGGGCSSVVMQTLAGTNTLGYPVGVFDVHGKLLGNATGPDQYVSLWNNDTADAAIGTLAKGSDSLHFNISVNAGKTLPAGVAGCRYYQFDIGWNLLDGVRSNNGVYVDFGDGTGMPIPANNLNTSGALPPNTAFSFGYFTHTYPDTSIKTLTFYHNDGTENTALDNVIIPAVSLTKIRNFRGNMPQQTTWLGGSCYQYASAWSLDNIANWNSISSVTGFAPHTGDSQTPCENLAYQQDFMKNNPGLNYINTTNFSYYQAGYRDTTFKLSKLKTDWNTYFTQLQGLEISDEHWDREDLSHLTHLTDLLLFATNHNHSNDPTNNSVIPIPGSVIDNIIIQIAAGSGQYNSNGIINILNEFNGRTSASDAAVAFLKSKGWQIYLTFSLQ